jgi:hypothetical protein
MKRTPDAIVSRSLAAILGGYLIANLVGIAATSIAYAPQAEGILIGMTLSFAIYAAAAIWAFAARSAKQAWGGLLLTGVIALLLIGLAHLASDTQ